MILTFLLSNWRTVLLAVLISSNAAMFHFWRSAEHGKVELELDFKLKVAQAEQATKEVQERSTKTLETINAQHDQAVKLAETNAVSNYLRRYGGGGLSIPSGSTSLPGLAYSSQKPDATQSTPVACDPRFLADAAKAAVMIDEYQRWVRGNHLPVEGE